MVGELETDREGGKWVGGDRQRGRGVGQRQRGRGVGQREGGGWVGQREGGGWVEYYTMGYEQVASGIIYNCTYTCIL